ncbi:hypothetical protein D3C84_1062730 [compost metagenome]
MRAVFKIVIGGRWPAQPVAATAGQGTGDAQVALHHEHVETGKPVGQLLAVSALSGQFVQLSIKTSQAVFQRQQMPAGDALHTQEQRQRTQQT